MQWRSALLYYHKTFFSAYAKVPYAEVERPCTLVVCDNALETILEWNYSIRLVDITYFQGKRFSETQYTVHST